MTSPHEKRLVKLLTRYGFELEVNPLGIRSYRRDGCREVTLYEQLSERAAKNFSKQIEDDVRRCEDRPPPVEESGWDVSQRLARVAEEANRARIRNLRLGGIAAGRTESEVDEIAARAEQLIAERRMFERLVRNRLDTTT